MSILRDTFIYFSQFVPRPALDAAFRLPSGDDHIALINDVETSGDDRRIAEIQDFIFSINQDGVQTRLSNVKGCYLFVDYGTITSGVDRVDVKTDRFHIAVTVACPRQKDQDQATEMLWQDKTLEILTTIRRQLRNDTLFTADSAPYWLEFPTTIQPWHAPGLSNSMGWTMELDITGTDIV